MPKPVQTLYDAVTAINRFIFRAVSLLMFVIVPVMLFAVISRYVFNSPSSWAMELATLVFGPYFLLAGPYLLHERGHVSLDLVQNASEPGVRRLLEMVNYPIIITFCGIMLFMPSPSPNRRWIWRDILFFWNPPIWPVNCSYRFPPSPRPAGARRVDEGYLGSCRSGRHS